MSEALNKLKEIKRDIEDPKSSFFIVNNSLEKAFQLQGDPTPEMSALSLDILLAYDSRIRNFVDRWEQGKFKPTPSEVQKFQEIAASIPTRIEQFKSLDSQTMEDQLKSQGIEESQAKKFVQESKQNSQAWGKKLSILNNLLQKSASQNTPATDNGLEGDSSVDNPVNQPPGTVPNQPIPANKQTSSANSTNNLGIEKKRCSVCEKVTFHNRNQCMSCVVKEELKNGDKEVIKKFQEELEAQKPMKELEAKRLQEAGREEDAKLLREFNDALLREVRGEDSKNSDSKSNTGLWIGLVIAFLAIAGLIGYIFWNNKKKKQR